MNDNQQLKQNFGAAMLYIGAVLNDLNFKYEFWNSKTAAYSGEKRTFYFPYLPLEVSQKAMDYIWGFVYHELGHALYTDFGALKKANDIGGLTEAVYRIFEDVWQEGKYKVDTPYSFGRLSKLSEVLALDDLLGATPQDAPETALVRNFFLNYGYSAVLGHKCVDEFAQSDEALMLQTFNQALVTKLKSLTFALNDCESSFDVLSIAQMVVTTFEEEKDNQDDSSEQNDESNGEDGETSSEEQPSSPGESSGDTDNNQNNSSEQSPQPSPDNKEQDGTDGSNGQVDDSNSELSNQFEQTSESITDAINNVLKASTDEFGKTDRGEMLQEGLTESIDNCGEALVYDKPAKPTVVGVDNNFLHLGEKVASGLIPRFKRLFEARAKVHKSRHKTGRKLIRNSTIKMITRDRNLFVKKTITTTVDTHISIVLDDSGSMNFDNKLEVSHQALAAIGLAAERTRGVDFSACSFPGNNNNDSVDVICTEKERFSSVSKRFQTINGKGSSTPMANGILWSMEQCARSKNPRKIIIVLTDGQPNHGHKQFVKEMVAKCSTYGVEVWGIGIKEDSVKNFFDDYLIINEIEELPQILLNKLTNCI